MKKIFLLVISTFVLFNHPIYANSKITQLPDISITKDQYAGYAQGIFYWYVKSSANPNKAPIILWTSGGPGTSSLYGFFVENGPYTCQMKSQKSPQFAVTQTHADWSTFANYLVLDQPLGIGLSFTQQKNYPNTPAQGNQQYYRSLQAFFNLHPQLRSHDIYLAGESYGATYMALLYKHIQSEKMHAKRLHVKGMIVISGWVDPTRQYAKMGEYAFSHGLINQTQKHSIDTLNLNCQTCQNDESDCNAICSKIYDGIQQAAGGIDLHNIGLTKNSDDWTTGPWINCLNNMTVREDIHAKKTQVYKPMTNIWDAYGRKQEQSVLPIYKSALQQGASLLVISGLNDASPCGYLGAKAWLDELPPYQSSSPQKLCWLPKNNNKSTEPLGYLNVLSPQVTWLTVRHAGHTVPTDQPKIAEIINHFINHAKLKKTSLITCSH